MSGVRQWWRGIKRLILTGEVARATPRGEPMVLGGRAAIRALGHRIGASGAGSRDELALATGLALTGARATTWLTGEDPEIATAVTRHLPLVLHAADDEGGHAACEAAVQAGWIVLHPQNLQEAIDLTLAGHHLAERALVPVLVVVDGAAIADAVQDVLLPEPDMIAELLGSPGDAIPAPTPAQALLFGPQRRRLPRWFDLDRPALHGSPGHGLREVSRLGFSAGHVPGLLAGSFAAVAAATGRPLDPLSRRDVEAAELVVVAAGSAVEIAGRVAAHLRSDGGPRVGVVGVRCVLGETGRELRGLLRENPAVLALRPLSAAAARGLPGAFSLAELPGSCTGYHGIGGLRAADLVALCREVAAGRRGEVFLGVEFLPGERSGGFPKREVLLQTLRREYPAVGSLGVRAAEPVDLRGEGALTLAVHRSAASGGEELAPAAAELLGGLRGSPVRSRIGRGLAVASRVDSVTFGGPSMTDPGDDVPVDLMVVLNAAGSSAVEMHAGSLRPGGAVLVPLHEGEELGERLGAAAAELRRREATLYTVAVQERSAPHEEPIAEEVLGAIFAVAQRLTGGLDTRRALRSREKALADLPESTRRDRLAAFERGVDRLAAAGWETIPREPAGIGAGEAGIPLAVRRLTGTGDALDSLPRFWDQVGVLYREGRSADLSPDPYLATGSMPPLTATFHQLEETRSTLPVFVADRCTGCGDCWTGCPDSALGPAAIDFAGILDAGMAAARDRGRNADALRSVAGKVAARAAKLFDAAGAPGVAGPVLAEAFERVLDKAAPQGDRRETLSDAFAAVLEQIEVMPIAKAAPFSAHGEVLSLAVDPVACKACGVCVRACEAEALVAEPRTPDRVAAARRGWELFERLPDTKGETIARVAKDPEVGRAAAMLLSKHCLGALSGGDLAEAGSGEKIAVRLALAAAELHLQPRLQGHLQDVAALQDQLQDKIRELMAASLPADLEDLDRALAQTDDRRVPLATLTDRARSLEDGAPDGAVDDRRVPATVDAQWLRRLVRTARELRELRERLTVGVSGLGRARLGVLLAPGNLAGWAAAYPYNPFPVPVALARGGATAELARGLCRGQLEAVLEDFRLLRRARLELSRPLEAAELGRQPLALADLTPQERALCPPLFVLGGDDGLGYQSLGELAGVLASDLPIKVLVATGVDLSLHDGSGLGRDAEHTDTPYRDLGLLAAAQRHAFVLQSSIGSPDHLVEGCLAALDHAGPAVLHVHAPSPRRHGFATADTLHQARRGIACGALPRFAYDPRGAGLFGLRITLEEGPEAGRTFADFAVTEGRFAAHFSELAADAMSPTPLAGYLDLPPEQRGSRTPFVESGEVRLRVSPAMVAASADRRYALRVLQELAGVVTPFTERIERAAAESVAAEREAEIAGLRREYEAKLQALRGELQAEFTVRLRDRLVELAERHRQRAGSTG